MEIWQDPLWRGRKWRTPRQEQERKERQTMLGLEERLTAPFDPTLASPAPMVETASEFRFLLFSPSSPPPVYRRSEDDRGLR